MIDQITEPVCKINSFKTKHWYLNGILHREDGPAIEWYDETKEWCQNGLLHREDGPAIERYNGDKEWFLNGKRHREDGPAIERYNGYKEWWLYGYFIKYGDQPKDWNELVNFYQVEQVMND